MSWASDVRMLLEIVRWENKSAPSITTGHAIQESRQAILGLRRDICSHVRNEKTSLTTALLIHLCGQTPAKGNGLVAFVFVGRIEHETNGCFFQALSRG